LSGPAEAEAARRRDPTRIGEARPSHLVTTDFPPGTQWAEMPGGIRLPLRVSTVRAEMSYADIKGGFVRCGKRRMPYLLYREACTTAACGERNPQFAGEASGKPAGQVAAATGTEKQGEAVPAGNPYLPDGTRCPAGHLYDGALHDQCPHCNPGQPGRMPSTPFGSIALPDAFGRALAIGRR